MFKAGLNKESAAGHVQGSHKTASSERGTARPQLDEPSEEFVRLFTTRVYSGRFTAAVQGQFRTLVRNAFRQFVRDQINERLKSAIRGVDASHVTLPDEPAEASVAADDEDDGITTTQEEIEGFHVVRAILAQHIDPKRVVMRDTKSYCGVLLDDNNRKPICRLRFNFSKKYLGLFDAEKNEERVAIESPLDIYKHADRLVQSVRNYDSAEAKEPVGAPAVAPPE